MDVICVLSGGFHPRVLSRIGKPIILVIYDLVPITRLADSVVGRSNRAEMYRNYVHLSDLSSFIVTPSEYTKSEVCKILNVKPSKVKKIYLGVDHVAFYPYWDKYREDSRGPRMLLNVGSMETRKNKFFLIKLFSEISSERKDLKLWCVGYNMELVKYAKSLGLMQKVAFLSNMPLSQLAELYRTADLFIETSMHEGLGLTVLESMASGTPVVSGAHSGISEALGDTGFVIHGYDLEEWRNVCLQALTDRAMLFEVGRKAYARSTLFTWQRCASELVKLFYETIQGLSPNDNRD